MRWFLLPSLAGVCLLMVSGAGGQSSSSGARTGQSGAVQPPIVAERSVNRNEAGAQAGPNLEPVMGRIVSIELIDLDLPALRATFNRDLAGSELSPSEEVDIAEVADEYEAHAVVHPLGGASGPIGASPTGTSPGGTVPGGTITGGV